MAALASVTTLGFIGLLLHRVRTFSLMKAAVAACVLKGRLTFWGPNDLGATPTFGSVVTGLGSGLDVDRFTEVWSPHGAVIAAGGNG